MRYRVRLWCRDCTGQDHLGCFDGGTEIMSDDDPPFDDATFATVEEAREAGYAATRGCGPWEFDIIDDDGNEIEGE